QAGSRAQTSLKGAIEARDLARLLDQAGQQAFISSEQATAKGSLHWPGDPGDFAVDRLQGSIEMRLKNGRLVEAGKINLLTRVFGLL
ncbi:AsmA-like C-terminal region-containing protein, partial [Acinetobacter baumannii]